MRRPDLNAMRPWVARPERRGHDAPWEVRAPARYRFLPSQLIGSLLSEEDARTIAAAHEAMDLVQRILDGASLEEIRSGAAAVMEKYEEDDIDPAAEDYAQQSRGE